MIEDPTQRLDSVPAERPQNGQAPASVPTPIRSHLDVPGKNTREFSLPSPYLGYRVTAWTNYPGRYADDISGDQRQLRLAAFSRIFISHNDWPDPDTGDALPQWAPGDVENFATFWEAIPQELRLAMQAAVGVEVGNVATIVQERRGGRR